MMALPEYAKRGLSAASGYVGGKMWVNCAKTNEWLARNLGLVTDDNEHRVGAYVVDFCWKAQRWHVKA
jgi:hypothetical protein